MELFDSIKSSLFGKEPENVEAVKQNTSPVGQIQNNFKFLTDMAKDMTSISESVKSLVEMQGGMPSTEANIDTTPQQVIEIEAGRDEKKDMKIPPAGKIAKILGTVLAVGGLVTMFWEDIKKAFMDFVSRMYDTIKEQFKEWLSSLGKWFGGIADTVMQKIKVLKDKLVEKVVDMFSAITEWMGEKIEKIVEFFQPVTDFIKKTYDKFISGFKDFIKDAASSKVARQFIPFSLLKFAGVKLTADEEREFIRKKLEDEGKLIDVSVFEKLGTRGKDAKIRAKLQEEANKRLIEIELQKLREVEEPDHTSQYKETSTYVAQTTPKARELTADEKMSSKFQDYAQTPTIAKQVIAEGPSSKGASSVTKVAGDDEIKAMIIGHEGVRNRPYKDSVGLWTVGVGHLIGNGKTLPKEMDRVFSDSEISEMFEMDYAKHKKIAERTPGYNKANKAGQGAMIDLGFNMGKWWPKWPNTSKALKAGDFDAAARGLEDSKWYTQVGNRAKTIVSLIENAGDQSGGADLSVASAAIGAGQRALSKPKTPNSFDNSQINNTVIVQNQSSNYHDDIDYSSYAASKA